MIVLDTNVVSELMRTSPAPAVEAWIAQHPVENLFFSAIGESELCQGVEIIPTGRRRGTLVSEIETMLQAPSRIAYCRSTAGLRAPMRSSPPSAAPQDVRWHP